MPAATNENKKKVVECIIVTHMDGQREVVQGFREADNVMWLRVLYTDGTWAELYSDPLGR